MNESSTAANRGLYWSAMAVVVAAHLAVLWIPSYNTLVDYPFHLCRAWALHTYDATPFFQAVFVRVVDPMPNLAIDLIVPPLMNFLPPLVAGKVFLSLTVLLYAAGCHLLAVAVYGRPSLMAPLAAFAAFNSTFLYGFVNSNFSTALFLVTLALWLRVRKRWTIWRWTALAALATATYIAHLSGFVFLAIAMTICIALEIWQSRRLPAARLIDFSILVPAVILQLYPWANKVNLSGKIVWGAIATKILTLSSALLGYHYELTVVTILLLGAALIVAIMKASVSLDRSLLVLGLAFTALCIICPYQLTAGGGASADARFMPPAFIFLLLSITVIGRPAILGLSLALAFGAMTLRLGDIGWSLSKASSAAEQQMAALSRAAPHSRIYDLFLRPANRETDKLTRGNVHLPCYSIILTQSVSSDFYARAGVQPLCFRHPEEWVGRESPLSFEPAFLNAHLGRFDYVWGCNLDAPHRSYLVRRATVVSSADSCALWKLDK